jgi:hypothetical protein
MTDQSPHSDLIASVPKLATDRGDDARALWRAHLETDTALGRLGAAAVSLCAMQDCCPPQPVERIRLLALPSPAPRRVTPSETSALMAATDSTGILVRTLSDPTTDLSAAQTMAVGAAAVDAEVDTGVDLLVLADMGRPGSVAAAIVGLLASRDAATVTPRPSALDDAVWMAECSAVREGMRRARDHRADPVALLDALAASTIALATGALLQAATRRTPMILDGTGPMAAALLAHRLAHRSTRWWWAASASTDPAIAAALERLDAEPLLSEPMPPGPGLAGVLAADSLRTVVTVMSSLGQTEA